MQQLLVKYPRDFKNIPTVTDYGKGSDVEANKSEEMVSSPPAHDHMLASHFFCSSPAALNASPLPSTPTCPLSSPLRGAGVWPGSGLALKVAGVARASEMHPPLTAVLGAGPCVPSNFEILTDVTHDKRSQFCSNSHHKRATLFTLCAPLATHITRAQRASFSFRRRCKTLSPPHHRHNHCHCHCHCHTRPTCASSHFFVRRHTTYYRTGSSSSRRR
jgi:hypothetical protein